MKLDKFQNEIVNQDPDVNLRIIGAPGSGKTRTLVSRYANLVNQHKIPTSRIVAITFSNKAATEMMDRVQADGIPLSNQGQRNICTINAFCHRMINDIRKSNGDAPLNIWTYSSGIENPAYKALRILSNTGYDADMSLFDRLNKVLCSSGSPSKEVVLDDPVLSQARSAPGSHSLFTVWKRYRKWLLDNLLTDFYGQLHDVEVLFTDKPVRGRLASHSYDKIICDEAQDMFPQALRISLILSQLNSIELYGDPSQTIYGFNGAKPEYLESLDMSIPGLKTLHLSNNYRSGRKIVELLNNFGPATSNLFKPMFQKNNSDGFITITGGSHFDTEIDSIARRVKENEYKLSDVAVLARTNAQCSVIWSALNDQGIEAYYDNKYSFWDKKSVKAGIGYMAIAGGQDISQDLVSILNVPSESYTDWNGKYSGSRYLKVNDFLGKRYDDIALGKVKHRNTKSLNDIKGVITKLKELDFRQRCTVVESLIVKWGQCKGQDTYEIEDDLALLWDRMERFDYNINKLKTYIDDVLVKMSQKKKNPNAVQVMTIHQSKGLEFPIVFLTGLHEPIEKSGGRVGFTPLNGYDENYLYYVGASRAIDELHLTYHLESQGQGQRLSSFVSDFAKSLTGGNDA